MDEQQFAIRSVAVIGGTGDLGLGLATRAALAGYDVIVGSRKDDSAAEAANTIRGICAERGTPSVSVSGLGNAKAAEAADVVVLTVPYGFQAATLDDIAPGLAGKILVTATVPLKPPKVARVQLPDAGSAAEEAAEQLGEDVYVVSALQNVAAAHLQADGPVECDVLVTGNSVAAREAVITLLSDCDLSAYHAGPINNSAAAEALTSLLIVINKRYKCHAGIRLTGLPD